MFFFSGRQFNKDGDSVIWWSEKSIANFQEREQCIIDQYSQYVLPENNKTVRTVLQVQSLHHVNIETQ